MYLPSSSSFVSRQWRIPTNSLVHSARDLGSGRQDEDYQEPVDPAGWPQGRPDGTNNPHGFGFQKWTSSSLRSNSLPHRQFRGG